MTDGDRPQDIGRSHRRRLVETDELVDAYRQAIRDELRDTIAELRPAGEQLGLDGGSRSIRPPIGDRVKLVDLLVKLGRELAAAPDPGPAPAEIEAGPTRATGRAPRLNARQRRELGAD